MQRDTPLLLSWTSCAAGNRRFWNIQTYSSDMSPCDCDVFVKVKEPLRGTRYNTRDEALRAIGRSILNINKDGCADGVRRLQTLAKGDK